MYTPNLLAQRWAELRHNSQLRIRDAAKQLKVSEVELVALGLGTTTTRLSSDFKTLLKRLPELGSVMALTRSDAAVHEITGYFSELSLHSDTALFFRPGLDTRYFLNDWHYGFAVNENGRLSLQFFDHLGQAVHKIYLNEHSNQAAYEQLIVEFKASEQTPLTLFNTVHTATTPEPDIDLIELRQAWSQIQDVHEGNRIIKRYGHQRPAVYRALGSEYAEALDTSCIEWLLTALSSEQLPLMLFAMNEAAVQSYSGKIEKLLRTGPWFNILDPQFNLHLRTQEIGEVWRVRKPSADGWVTSLDVFDWHGQEILVFTDQRERGQQESSRWTELLMSYPSLI